MEKKDNFLEDFKTAIASTAKSISKSENIEVIFGNQNYDEKKETITTSKKRIIPQKKNAEQLRATTQRNKNNGKNFVLQPPLRAVPDQQDGQRVFF